MSNDISDNKTNEYDFPEDDGFIDSNKAEEPIPFEDNIFPSYPPLPDDLMIPFYKTGFVPFRDHSYEKIYNSPKKIYAYLEDNVYGHPGYKRALSIFFWKVFNDHRPQGALLVAGQSGTGKTEMIRSMEKIYNNILVIDGSSVTAQGWKGENKIYSLLKNLDFTLEAPMGVVVIDEFDKLIFRARSFPDSGLMSELLKLLEGGTINAGREDKPFMVNTENIAFILLGAFSNLSENKKHHAFGFESEVDDFPKNMSVSEIMDLLPPELQGRIGQTVLLDQFTESDFKNIMKSEKYSPVKRIGQDLGVEISVSRRRANTIAKKAFKSGTGVRSMNNEITRFLDDILFEHPDIKQINMN